MKYVGALVVIVALPFVVGYAWNYLTDQARAFRRR